MLQALADAGANLRGAGADQHVWVELATISSSVNASLLAEGPA